MRRRIRITALWVCAWILPGLTQQPERPSFPVILKGDKVPLFLGLSVENLRVYRYEGLTGTWLPIPFQIDERDAAGLSFFGPKNGRLDEVDEIVWMSCDLGDPAPIADWVTEAEAWEHPRYEIAVPNPRMTDQIGYVYLYGSPSLSRSPIRYVTYEPTTDRVTTESYAIGHGAGGFQDEIRYAPEAGGDGIDFVDRQKLRIKVLIRELGLNKEVTLKEEMDEDVTLLPGFPAHVTVKKKSVRTNTDPVIRLHRDLELRGSFRFKFLGTELKIDTSFYFPMVYYRNYMELRTGEIAFKRQEAFDVTEFRISMDLNPDATGMLYYNHNAPDSLRIDGLRDTPKTTVFWPGTNWFMAKANPTDRASKIRRGTLLTVLRLAGQPFGNPRLYYQDYRLLLDPSDTGDKRSYGDAGFQVTGSALSGRIDAAMGQFFLVDNLSPNRAAAIAQAYATPFEVIPTVQRVWRLLTDVDPPDAGEVRIAPPGPLYPDGSAAFLTAVPHPGYVFSHWGGACTGTANPTHLVLGTTKRVIAYFVPRAYVTVRTDPPGITFRVDGIRLFSKKTFAWIPGETHTISADSLTGIYTGVRARFLGWNGDPHPTIVYVVPFRDDTVTGTFMRQYQLTTAVRPIDGGRIETDPPELVWGDEGIPVVLTAIPAPGYGFLGWQGDLQGTDNPATRLLDRPLRITGLFGNAPPHIARADTAFAEDDTLVLDRKSFETWASDPTHPDSLLTIRLWPGRHVRVSHATDLGKYLLFADRDWFGVDSLRIEAADPLGATGSGHLLVTVWPIPDPPGPFALLAPEEGETFLAWPKQIVFSWEPSIDPDGEAVQYRFELDRVPTFGGEGLIQKIGWETTQLVLDWPNHFTEGTYYWRVFAEDPMGFITAATDTMRRLILATGVVRDQGTLPTTFSLEQNYPNPFNAETRIRYALPKQASVRLSVYDTRGRCVAVLVDGVEEAGYHTVVWPMGEPVASGLYVLHMEADTYRAIRKMLYLR